MCGSTRRLQQQLIVTLIVFSISFHGIRSSFVTELVCPFENGNMCGWINGIVDDDQIEKGKAGIMSANNATKPFPLVDSNPGNANGSYFFYQRDAEYFLDSNILKYPRQRYVSGIGFDHYITGLTLLSVLKTDNINVEVISDTTWSENTTGKWQHAFVNFSDAFSPDYGFWIVSSSVEESLGEAVSEIDSTLSIDNLTVEFTLPCNFDALHEKGSVEVPDHTVLDIPLGKVTVLSFKASSTVCPDGPFYYYIKSNSQPVLDNIFSLNSTTGDLTVNASGSSYLVTSGVSFGKLLIAVYVMDSDYLDTGEYAESSVLLVFQQDPTISIESPGTIDIQAGTNFTYQVQATSGIGSALKYSNLKTKPESLTDSISLDTSGWVSGQLTSTGLIDIIKAGKQPYFSVEITDIYGGSITSVVYMMLPATPPTFDSDQYQWEIKENTEGSTIIGNFTVGDINENNCNDISVTLSGASSYFSILNVGSIYDSDQLCMFLILVNHVLDYEINTQYDFAINATDSSGRSTVVMVTVNVLSDNEFPPMFKENNGIKVITDYMSEVGKLIFLFSASDKDGGIAGKLSYEIVKGNAERNFKLDQISNGEVELQSNSDGLVPGTYVLTIMVTDGQYPFLSDTLNVTVAVTEGDIDCTLDYFNPPVAELTTGLLLHVPINDDVILYCNHTSFPPSYPVTWIATFIKYNTISTIPHDDSHYMYNGNNLIIMNVTQADSDYLFQCNITNPCGSESSDFISLLVIEIPESVSDLTIIEGPSIYGHVGLDWTPPPNTPTRPIDGYKVMLKESGKGTVLNKHVDYHEVDELNPVSETSLTGLKPGTNYSVRVVPYNLAGEGNSNEVSFMTPTSAPRLSLFEAVSLDNHSIRVDWSLDYNGGSELIQMSINIRSHVVTKKRSANVEMRFDVGVDQQTLVTPALPFGRSYEISATIVNEYGSRTHTTTTFVGFQDVIKCSFTNTSSCGWNLGPTTSLQSTPPVDGQPLGGVGGDSVGSYVISLPPASEGSWNVLYHHSISYLCGYSFYYQVFDKVGLILMSASSIWNETVYWSSGRVNVLEWTLQEVSIGDIPISATPHEVIFVMESFGDGYSGESFVAVDEVSLYFCLPCDYTTLTNDSFSITAPNNFTVYLRTYQTISLQTEVQGCSNPVLNYAVKEVTPTILQSMVSVPNPREGVVVVDGITPYIARVGTQGHIQISVEVASANYKGNGLTLSKLITIPFFVTERFENCSYVSSCYFENETCDWTLVDQSDVRLEADSSGNGYVIADSSSQSADNMIQVLQRDINDSYCGINFMYKTQTADVQVSVDGLGLLWSSAVEDEFDHVTQQTNSTSLSYSPWQEVSLYIDVMSVEVMSGRKVAVDMVTTGNGDNPLDTPPIAVFDNVTLHPCVDCQAKDCSCISCIQQCTADPCQSGYYLSLEINQCRPCPKGYYCTSWRSLPTPCPPGTFTDTTGTQTEADCQVS